MIWMLTATASMLATPEREPLTPLERAWGGTEPCDARAILVEAGEQVVHPTDVERIDAPNAMLLQNLHVLEAWQRAERCATVARGVDGLFHMYSAGQVLVAAARAEIERNPRLAAERALDALAAGNDASAGPLVSTMVGRALHSEALDVLAEVWPALSPSARERLGSELRAIHRVRPRMDLEAERATAVEMASNLWLEGTCLDAHEEALGHAERALALGKPELLEDRRAPSLSEWLTGCGHGIEAVTGQYLEEEVDLARQVDALAG